MKPRSIHRTRRFVWNARAVENGKTFTIDCGMVKV